MKQKSAGAGPIISAKSKSLSTVTTKKSASKGGVTKVSKKLKRENKRSGLLSKLTASHAAKEEVRKAKIRSQKAIVGDMDPLLSALQDIHVLNNNKGLEAENSAPANSRGKKKSAREKKRIASDLNDINLFRKVTEHEKFVQSPVAAIQDHVKYMMSMETT